MLMADATEDCLTTSLHQDSGNVDQLVIAMRKAKVELVSKIDGVVLENTIKNNVLRVAYSVERALNARPPQEVIDAVLGRIRSLKHAPRTNKTACAALATTLIDNARSFAAQDAASAGKVTIKLGDFPIIDDATLEQREHEYNKWTAATPAGRADV